MRPVIVPRGLLTLGGQPLTIPPTQRARCRLDVRGDSTTQRRYRSRADSGCGGAPSPAHVWVTATRVRAGEAGAARGGDQSLPARRAEGRHQPTNSTRTVTPSIAGRVCFSERPRAI